MGADTTHAWFYLINESFILVTFYRLNLFIQEQAALFI